MKRNVDGMERNRKQSLADSQQGNRNLRATDKEFCQQTE
jgi:hypothetical protein